MADSDDSVKEVREAGDALVVALAGEIDLHRTPAVHKALVAACQRKPARYVRWSGFCMQPEMLAGREMNCGNSSKKACLQGRPGMLPASRDWHHFTRIGTSGAVRCRSALKGTSTLKGTSALQANSGYQPFMPFRVHLQTRFYSMTGETCQEHPASKGPHKRAFCGQAGLPLFINQQLALLVEQVTHLVVFER